jgi:hypothetical protein
MVGLWVIGLFRRASERGITQDELVRRTQEPANVVAVGDQTPWKKYFADDCMYFDESGRKKNKEAVLSDLTPLPRVIQGTSSSRMRRATLKIVSQSRTTT